MLTNVHAFVFLLHFFNRLTDASQTKQISMLRPLIFVVSFFSKWAASNVFINITSAQGSTLKKLRKMPHLRLLAVRITHRSTAIVLIGYKSSIYRHNDTTSATNIKEEDNTHWHQHPLTREEKQWR